jgi:hypothetical protein
MARGGDHATVRLNGALLIGPRDEPPQLTGAPTPLKDVSFAPAAVTAFEHTNRGATQTCG